MFFLSALGLWLFEDMQGIIQITMSLLFCVKEKMVKIYGEYKQHSPLYVPFSSG